MKNLTLDMGLKTNGWIRMMRGPVCVAIAGIVLLLAGCQSGIQKISEEEYQQLLKEEVPKGLQEDKLFFGLSLGMSIGIL
ncbi:MAG: hypothetical protein AAFR59_06600 [Bacteroidota bacterium]